MDKKYNLKNILILSLLLIFLTVIIVKQVITNSISSKTSALPYYNKFILKSDRGIHDSLHRAVCNLKSNKEYQTNMELREQLNAFFAEKFEKCNSLELYSFNSRDNCSVNDMHHYIDTKFLLNKLSDEEKEKIANILDKTYEKNKYLFIKDFISINDNRLWKTLDTMNWFNLLNQSEKEFWILQYSKMKFSDSQPIFPQTYNRIRVFLSVGVNSSKDLEKYNITPNTVCAYNPSIEDAFVQDIFREGVTVMTGKYISIKNFCMQEINISGKNTLSLYSGRIIDCEGDN